ncbi:MAG: hypothetical protein RL754_511 [Bacteroidota bacterium]
MGSSNTYQQVINNIIALLALALLATSCVGRLPEEISFPLGERNSTSETLYGNEAYLESKQMTPGNRAYCVGFQDGTFPDIGWHIEGEMGGLWAHPIKLLDGFSVALIIDGDTILLDRASSYSTTALASTFSYEIKGHQVVRTQYIPEMTKGMVVEYDVSALPRGAELVFKPRPDLRPTWLGERTNMVNSNDLVSVEDDRWAATDSANGWQVMITTATNSPHSARISKSSIHTPRAGIHQFYIAGGLNAHQAALELERTEQWNDKWYHSSQKHFELSEMSSFFCEGEEKLETVFRWLKHNAIWLEMDADTLGYGFVAGIEDYPWFFGCDSEFSILGLNAIGRYDLSKSMLRLIAKASERNNGTGQIIHEMSTNGAVFNLGNLNETPQFVKACWDTYVWSGDLAFLQEMYPLMLKSMRWLEKQDLDNNGIPNGYGMMEIHGMNGEMIDVASYSVQGWEAMSKAALALKDETHIDEWAGKHAALLTKYINDHYWIESEGTYADVRGLPMQAIELIEDAIERAQELNKPWALAELEQTKKLALDDLLRSMPDIDEQDWSPTPYPYSIHHNWIVNTPMEVGFAPEEYALKALDKAAQYTNPFGMFVTGIDRDESAGQDSDGFAKRKKTFSYVGAVMTLPTGVAAVAENNYGRPDKALDYLHRMSRSWGYAHPGSMYEVSPDFGMMVQAWNIYSFAYPIVRQFFGVHPNPQDHSISIDLSIPSTWEHPQLKGIRIGEGHKETFLDVTYLKGDNEHQLLFYQQGASIWSVKTAVPPNAIVLVDDAPVEISRTTGEQAEFHGRKILIRW